MVQWFQKPENALKRAQELLEVGKKEDALETLHDVIKSRRHRQWTKVHEEIMKVHLRLCVEVKKPLMAKDALWQYRNNVQAINVKSLEDVVSFYLDLAEKKAEAARKEAAELAAAQGRSGLEDAPDDLDMADSPESLLLSAVTGADAQDRADRTVLSPWLRFMWESYRQCLELLRNNVQVEQLYHKIARQALDFCAKYQRRAEFRKLCDNLRTHLSQLHKSQHASYSVKLNNPETIQAMQETRLHQLDMAIQMELWQEAFKSCEDVHGLVLLSGEKRLLKPQAVANYYEKLALVFWKAGNRLFHAAALLKLLKHCRDMKRSWGGEEAMGLASRALLAALAIPPGANSPSQLARFLDIEEMAAGNVRKLSSLLELTRTPTRASLLKDGVKVNLLQLAGPEARELYSILEERFDPLHLAAAVQVQLESAAANEELAQYVPVLRDVAALRILQQAAEVYESVSLERVAQMVPFLDPVQLERLAVSAAKKSHIIMRVDHRGSALELKAGEGLVGRGAEGREELERVGDPSEALVEEVGNDEGDLTDQAGKAMRNQIESLYLALSHASHTINAPAIHQAHLKQLEEKIKAYQYHKKEDQNRIGMRRKRIEGFKEDTERRRQQLEDERLRKAAAEEDARKREEIQRLAKEQAIFDEAEKAKKKAEIVKQIYMDKLSKLRATRIGQRIIDNVAESDIREYDIDKLYQEQIRAMERNMAEQQENLAKQEKRWDHLVRAFHVEEIPLRKAEYAEWAPKHRSDWDAYEKERVAKEIAEHEHRQSTFTRLQRMRATAADFLKTVKTERAGEVEQRQAAWEAKVASERERRLTARREDRKAKRRAEWEAERAEEQRRAEKDREEEERRRLIQASKGQRPDDDRRRGRGDDEGGFGESDMVDDWRAVRQGPLDSGPARGGPGARGPPMADESSNWRRDGPPPSSEMEDAREMVRRAAGPSAEDSRDWRAERAGPLPPPPSGGPGGASGGPPPRREEPDQWRGAAAPMPEQEAAGNFRRPPPMSEADQGPWRGRGPIEDMPPPPRHRGPADEEGPWTRGHMMEPPPPASQYPRRDEMEREWRREGPPPPPQGNAHFAANPRFDDHGAYPPRDFDRSRMGPISEPHERAPPPPSGGGGGGGGGGAYRPPGARGGGGPPPPPPSSQHPRDDWRRGPMDNGPPPPRRNEDGGRWERGAPMPPSEQAPPDEEGWNTVPNKRGPGRNEPARDMTRRW